MMATAHPKLAMRPILPTDAPLVAEIFRASIEELTGGRLQRGPARGLGGRRRRRRGVRGAAWQAADAARHDRAARRSASRRSRAPSDLDMLYVHPAAAGQGVGTMLVDALEKLAAARGAAKLTADVSDSAQDFFRKRGFVAADAQHGSARRRMARQHDDGKEAGREGACAMSEPETPFPRHWLYYIVLKYAVIAAPSCSRSTSPIVCSGRQHERLTHPSHRPGGDRDRDRRCATLELLSVVIRCPANASISSTPRCATARRPTASTSRSTTSSRSPACSTISASTMSRAAIRAPIRPTRSFSRRSASSTPPSPPSA